MIGFNLCSRCLFRVASLSFLALLTAAPQAWATWSMVIINTHTGEVAIGQATCVPNVDLLDWTPIMMTQTGGATVAAYSVGQQIALAAFSLLVGFACLALIFKIRSFREVIRQGKAQQAAESDAEPEAEVPAPAR